MNITEYITSNGGYISSEETKKVSLYDQLLYGTRTGFPALIDTVPQADINRVDDEILPDAIKSTFTNRKTGYRENHPLFTEEFFASKDRQSFWNGFLRKIKYPESIDFQTVGLLIRERLQPYWESLRGE